MDSAGIKYALNSLLGATGFKALDQYLSDRLKGSGMAAFTAPGSYTWTVPPNVNEIWLTACAGGGGGGGGAASAVTGGPGGGGAQCVYRKKYTVTPNSNIAITVGTGGPGGAAGTTAATPGTAGGNTVIGSLVTLTGGAAGTIAGAAGSTDGTGGPGGGSWVPNSAQVGGSGGGGSLGGGGGGGVPYRSVSNDGQIIAIAPGRIGVSGLIGQGGFPGGGVVVNPAPVTGSGGIGRMPGQGGASPFGAGKASVITTPEANATAGGAGGPGGGGGGGGQGSNTIAAGVGGKGGDGLVIIEY